LERINNQLLIERTIERISPLAQPVLVVTSREQFNIISASRLKASVVVDSYPGKGALGGLYTGLTVAASLYSFVVGCDMPFLNRDLIGYIIDNSQGFDVVVPKIQKMAEPLHALYSKNCLQPIFEMMQEGVLGILHLFDLVKTRYIDERELAQFDIEKLSFFNINTLADLKKARQLIEVEGR
jgi:molybdopterin-guanine dinucleotide biosynthesis protein A